MLSKTPQSNPHNSLPIYLKIPQDFQSNKDTTEFLCARRVKNIFQKKTRWKPKVTIFRFSMCVSLSLSIFLSLLPSLFAAQKLDRLVRSFKSCEEEKRRERERRPGKRKPTRQTSLLTANIVVVVVMVLALMVEGIDTHV